VGHTTITDDEAQQLREERDRYRTLWLRAADECTALAEKLTERDEMLERAHDHEDAAFDIAASWQEWSEAAEAELAEERQAREALLRVEIERLTGHAPKPRGRPPLWSPNGEAEVELRHRAGASIRQLAVDLGVSKSQVHRIVTRVRRQHAAVAERARVDAIAAGRSPTQRAARVAKQAAERRPIEDYDPTRAERGLADIAGS
jgi:hypothetical protein